MQFIRYNNIGNKSFIKLKYNILKINVKLWTFTEDVKTTLDEYFLLFICLFIKIMYKKEWEHSFQVLFK